MDIYSIALFFHIVGALGISIALGLEWTGLWQIRSAILPEQVRTWMGILKSTNRVGFPSMLTMVITGIYMMTEWGGVAWIFVTMGALAFVIVLSAAFSRPKMFAIGQALITERSPFSQNFHNLVNHPILWISLQTRVAIVLGIILLKIAKPDLGGSLLTIGAATVLGIASALTMSRRLRAHEVPTT